jgi:hypothetical protein
MPYDNQFIDEMNGTLDHLTDAQGDVLAKRLTASYMAGWTIEQGGKLTTVQERSIKLMAASTVGYISEFNEVIGTQIAGHISELMVADVLSKDIAKELIPYIDDIFGPDGKVVINNIGKKRSIIKVAKDGTLSKVDKVITQKYTTSPENYADVLSRTSTHNALEQGRAEARQAKGVTHWIFTGPIDSRSRPDHAAVVGNVYEYGTDQSDMARELLSAPNCRHRSIEYFGDKELDTPKSHYETLKKDAGLKYEKGEWALPTPEL